MLEAHIKTIIRAEAIEAERLRQLTQEQLAIIYENRWFHLLVPIEYGGPEMDLPSFALFMEELASIDGSFAWNVNLGAGANMFAGYLNKETARNMFLNPKTCIAGSGAVSGIAHEENNFYRINGYWKYASGSAHANFFSLNATLGETSSFSSFIVPRSAVEIVDTWKVSGLKATASYDFKVKEYKVSKAYAFDLMKPSPNCSGALYRFPFQLLAEINMLVMSTGLASRFIALAKEIAVNRNSKGGNRKLIEHSIFKSACEYRENKFLAAREHVFDTLFRLWEKVVAGDTISLLEQEAFTNDVLQSAHESRKLVDAIFPFMGMHTVFESSEINRVWRDFKVASQHAVVSPERIVS